MSFPENIPVSSAAKKPPERAYLTERHYGVDRLPVWNRLAYIHGRLQNAIAGAVADLQLEPDSCVLDYGCADSPYRKFLPVAAQYMGADIKGNHLADIEISAEGGLPCESEKYDAVLSTQVLEHVDNPANYLKEAYRVLRPGGALLLSTHGIMVYHEDPVDYWRWTGSGLVKILEEAGFRVSKLEGIMGLAPAGLQMFQDAIYPALPKLLRPIWALCLQGLIALSDRLHSPESRQKNALVFLAIAYKDS